MSTSCHRSPSTTPSVSKAEYLASVAFGEIDYRAWEIVSAIEVRPYGEAAVIRYPIAHRHGD